MHPPVLAYLDREQLSLTAILATHHHNDHVGGVPALVARFPVPVFGPANETIPARTRGLREGDIVKTRLPDQHVKAQPLVQELHQPGLGGKGGAGAMTGFAQLHDAGGADSMGEGQGGVTIEVDDLNGNKVAETTTWDEGGYQIPLAPGSYKVTALDNDGTVIRSDSVTVGKESHSATGAARACRCWAGIPVCTGFSPARWPMRSPG